MALNHQISPFL